MGGAPQVKVTWLVVACGLFGPVRLGHTQTGDEAEARRLYQEGRRHYNIGEYERAIERFKAAYLISQAPLLLYNIAQAYRLEGSERCGEAVQFYQRYLTAVPEAPERRAVERRLVELEPCARARAQPAPDAAAPIVLPRVPEAPPGAKRSRSKWPLVVAAVGGGLAVAGAVLNWRASTRFDDLRAQCGHACPTSAWDGWDTATDVSHVLIAVGSATAATGMVVWLLPSRSSEQKRTLGVAPFALGLSAAGAF
jgi:tetratricopeptide (TPR) repeat protein